MPNWFRRVAEELPVLIFTSGDELVLRKTRVCSMVTLLGPDPADWLDQTIVPYRKGEKVVWDVFGKEKSVGATDLMCYHFVRDETAARLLTDGRHSFNTFKPWSRPKFAMPIIAAASTDGDVLAFFVDPRSCSNIGGQHHKNDTARDWAIGTNLKKGQVWTTHARMIYRRVPGEERKRLAMLQSEYQRFVTELVPDRAGR